MMRSATQEVQTNDRGKASEETIDVIVTARSECREEQESTSVEVYTTTLLISMMIRTAGSKLNNSLSGYHTADPSSSRMTNLLKRSESMA